MSLYTEWNEEIDGIQNQEDYKAFWNKYMLKETDIYKIILMNNTKVLKGTIKELGEKYDASPKQIIGFLDGANSSFVNKVELEEATEETLIEAEFDFEKLLWNMHEAKADWLYGLKEWDNILDIEKRKQIKKDYNRSKQAVRGEKIGRNDPCPCGSGKKYKKCCGKNI